MRGCLGKDRLDSANSSTQVLELAEPRWGWLAKSGKTWQHRGGGGGGGRTRVGRLGLQNQGGGGAKKGKTRWWVAGQQWRGKTEVMGDQTRAGRLGFANLSTQLLELAKPR